MLTYDPIVTLDGVSKSFNIGGPVRHTALLAVVNAVSGKEPTKKIWALKDVSFEMHKGEMLGLVGSNGAGKSTLLSIIAGIYQCTEGRIVVRGKVISVIGLARGLADRLTMSDNIYLCCTFFGLSKKEITKRFDAIVKMTQLEDFVETKLYQFSTGMLGRLVFSIAVHCDPDVLLLDEVNSNMDKDFIDFADVIITRIAQTGVAVFAVSHKKEIIEQCHRALWLEKGRVVAIGGARDIARRYWSDGQPASM